MEGSAAIHGTSVSAAEKADQIGTLFCFSHLRWDFVFQRPQHLMTRLARRMRVVFWEEPRVVANLAEPQLALRTCAQSGVTVAVPELPDGLDAAASALHDRAADLPGGESVRNAARATADRLGNSAEYVRTHDARSMMADIESLVKSRPGPALAVAAAFGFLLGRALSRD